MLKILTYNCFVNTLGIPNEYIENFLISYENSNQIFYYIPGILKPELPAINPRLVGYTELLT